MLFRSPPSPRPARQPSPRPNPQNPPLNTSRSVTYKPISCLSFQCLTGTCSGASCVYFDQYADGSTSQGLLVQEDLSIGPITASAIIGCENSASGNIFIEPSDGIMGLGLGQVSVFSQMVDAQLARRRSPPACSPAARMLSESVFLAPRCAPG